jgi:hypothetical protein
MLIQSKTEAAKNGHLRTPEFKGRTGNMINSTDDESGR